MNGAVRNTGGFEATDFERGIVFSGGCFRGMRRFWGVGGLGGRRLLGGVIRITEGCKCFRSDMG